jgi:proline dehydrogenase
MLSFLARSATLKRLASQYGMTPNGFARRFIAGETINEAIDAARALQGRGMHVALDYLGESVSTIKAATAASREYVQLMETIVASGIERNVHAAALQ